MTDSDFRKLTPADLLRRALESPPNLPPDDKNANRANMHVEPKERPK